MTASPIARQRMAPGVLRTRQATVGVALLDPVPLFREGLSALVARTPGLHWAGSTRNHRAAAMLQEQHRPDVLLIDSALDPLGHFTRMLTDSDHELVVVVLLRDAHRTAEFANRMFRRGARGLVPRHAEPAQVVQAIHQAPIARRYLDPAIAPLMSMTVDGGLAPHTTGHHGQLTRREYEVLQLISEGLENRAIARELFVSVETVRTHIKGILRKLSARDRAHAVAVAFRMGLLACAPDR
ncbi:LuxR C-terminal-related transcriptional regulator [Kutzneria albida]|uniref:HTH luxR-type domain-containing protein n=1 Tax=Kutzneria albida DSM 43870 TaxID=1449976 RepID=W5WV37_9PSEU|nr:response regulator transcription factor [Kutzneria albida]AHI02020.1 hypothetical protein KALB_8663 [Kutzneria albida DSM 43870]